MSQDHVFTLISRWLTFSSTVNLCNINCIIFSDMRCPFGPPIVMIVAQSIGVNTKKIMKMACKNLL